MDRKGVMRLPVIQAGEAVEIIACKYILNLIRLYLHCGKEIESVPERG
jgi:hypothetical protein